MGHWIPYRKSITFVTDFPFVHSSASMRYMDATTRNTAPEIVRFGGQITKPYADRLARLRRDHRKSYGAVIEALIDELDGKQTFLSQDPNIALDALPIYVPEDRGRAVA